jgi:nitronate monooxygenase
MAPTLVSQYPWTKAPLICNAPMGGFATHVLAAEVSRAGGLGFIGPVFGDLSPELQKARETFQINPLDSSYTVDEDLLPLGLGFILWAAKLDEIVAVVAEYKPSVLWLFAAPNATTDYKTWTSKLRQASPKSKIWIQTGSVASALSLAEECKPDVLVMQGIDAGGHGFEKGAGIISLVPETIDALAEKGINDISIVASGGIVEGRGAAAALTLGAEGVVLGTRFLASKEVSIPTPIYQKAILEGKDGGQSTIRDKVFDQLRGPNRWPGDYDGRALVNKSYEDWKSGTSLEEVQKLTKETEDAGRGFGDNGHDGRAALWVGTGIGLVKEVMAAKDIVIEVREGIHKAMEIMRAKI